MDVAGSAGSRGGAPMKRTGRIGLGGLMLVVFC
ncbi:MAG: hypothetical protein H6Q85_3104, partial [candidate division NC10 bacterium]|nr:hypothetical protein [candidate division NC10 bacterium]